MGDAHADRITHDACVKASLTLIDRIGSEEYPALIEHMRLRGDLTASFLVRAVAHGKVDFFGAALVALTGQSERRVRALLANGFDAALRAVFAKAGLSRQTHEVLLCALKIWRRGGARQTRRGRPGGQLADAEGTGRAGRQSDLAALLKSIHLDVLRANARGHALAIAAA